LRPPLPTLLPYTTLFRSTIGRPRRRSTSRTSTPRRRCRSRRTPPSSCPAATSPCSTTRSASAGTTSRRSSPAPDRRSAPTATLRTSPVPGRRRVAVVRVVRGAPFGPGARRPGDLARPSADAVQPAHRHALAGVAVDLEVLVPGAAQGDAQLAAQSRRIVAGPFHAAAHMVLGEHDVAGVVGRGMVDAELRGAAPARPVDRGRGFLGDLEAHLVHTARRADGPGAGVLTAPPGHLGPLQPAAHRLVLPAD